MLYETCSVGQGGGIATPRSERSEESRGFAPELCSASQPEEAAYVVGAVRAPEKRPFSKRPSVRLSDSDAGVRQAIGRVQIRAARAPDHGLNRYRYVLLPPRAVKDQIGPLVEPALFVARIFQ